MENQLALDLTDQGIQRALDHANNSDINWSDKAYKLFELYLKTHPKDFLNEDFREFAAKMGLPEPPSLRAYGGIIRKAKTAGIIIRCGFRSVKNPKAHLTPASVWRRKDM